MHLLHFLHLLLLLLLVIRRILAQSGETIPQKGEARMNTMFETGEYFVRVQNKGGHRKITIWDNKGDKLFSDFLGPDPALQFWNRVEALTGQEVVLDVKKRVV